MRIAFYAPLKAPGAGAPSGDRLIGELLLRALRDAGHDVTMASRFRSFDRAGSDVRQRRMAAIGAWLGARLLKRFLALPKNLQPQVWVTYHLYHKAPDWLGPAITKGLTIPYVIVEASHPSKPARDRWRIGSSGVETALQRARLVVNLNARDAAGIGPFLNPDGRSLQLPPFIDGARFRRAHARRAQLRQSLRAGHGLDATAPRLVTVAMMRADQKLASYQVLAQALALIQDEPWSLVIIGEGAARPQIEALFQPLQAPTRRVVFAGQLKPDDVADTLAACDLFVWPGIKEAIGMVYLEAQAAGLPVVGANREGIAGVVADGETGLLVPEGDAAAFARAVSKLLRDAPLRHRLSDRAFTRARARHDIETVGPQFARLIESVVDPGQGASLS